MIAWLAYFALTVAVEVPIAVALAPRSMRRRMALDAFLVNLASHPAAWLLLARGLLDWWSTETLVALAECFAYRAVTGVAWPRAAGIALAANGVTAALSFIV